RRAEAQFEHAGQQGHLAVCAIGRAAVAYLRGDLPQADAVARRGLTLSEGIGDQQPIAVFCYRLGQIASEQGDPAAAAACCRCALAAGRREEAEGHLRAVLALQTAMGIPLAAARTRLALAETLGASADPGTIPQETRTLLADRQAQFAAIGALLDVARAEELR